VRAHELALRLLPRQVAVDELEDEVLEPPVCVGPAITEFTVTPVPAAALANPRETPSSAVFETP
jgi:hypothetical protein